jgi:hypothetical protein
MKKEEDDGIASAAYEFEPVMLYAAFLYGARQMEWTLRMVDDFNKYDTNFCAIYVQQFTIRNVGEEEIKRVLMFCS